MFGVMLFAFDFFTDLFEENFWKAYSGTWVWGATAAVMFFCGFKLLDRYLLPGCFHKDIVEKGNVALAIVYAAVVLTLGQILAAAIR